MSNAHACTAGVILCTAGACYTGIDHPWLAGSGLYVAAFLAWCAARLRAERTRVSPAPGVQVNSISESREAVPLTPDAGEAVCSVANP